MTTATTAAAAAAIPAHREPALAAPRAIGERAIASVCIATINRPEGDTGVHTHTRMLAAGLAAAGVRCDVVSAVDDGMQWLPAFAVPAMVVTCPAGDMRRMASLPVSAT